MHYGHQIPCRWMRNALAVLAGVASAVCLPILAFADEVAAERIAQLERLSREIREESIAVSGMANPGAAIGPQETRLTETRATIARLEEAAALAGVSKAEIEELGRAAKAGRLEPDGRERDATGKFIAKQVGRQLVGQAAKRLLGAVGRVLDAAEEGGYYLIRSMTARELAEMAKGEAERIALLEDLISASHLELEEQYENLARLKALQEESRQVFEALAEARQRETQTNATIHAVTARDMDSAGDEEELAKHRAYIDGPRPAIEITWYTSSTNVDTHAVFDCPPNPDRSFSNVFLYGTNRFAVGSTICVAAAHAGVISVERGGRVWLQMFELDRGVFVSFVGSEQNGIRSQSYGDSSIHRSFIPRPDIGDRARVILSSN